MKKILFSIAITVFAIASLTSCTTVGSIEYQKNELQRLGFTCNEGKPDEAHLLREFECKSDSETITLAEYDTKYWPSRYLDSSECIDRYSETYSLGRGVYAIGATSPFAFSTTGSMRSLSESCTTYKEAKKLRIQEIYEIDIQRVAKDLILKGCSNIPSGLKFTYFSEVPRSIQFSDTYDFGPLLFKKDGTPFRDSTHVRFYLEINEQAEYLSINRSDPFMFNTSGNQIPAEEYPDWTSEDIVNKNWNKYGCPSDGYIDIFFTEILEQYKK